VTQLLAPKNLRAIVVTGKGGATSTGVWLKQSDALAEYPQEMEGDCGKLNLLHGSKRLENKWSG